MRTHAISFRRRLGTVAAATALLGAAVLISAPNAAADDLPAPTVRRSSAGAPAPTRSTRTTASTRRRSVTSRTAARSSERRTAASSRRPAASASVRGATLPSEPLGWQVRKRHSTYVPPMSPAASRAARSTRATATPPRTTRPQTTRVPYAAPRPARPRTAAKTSPLRQPAVRKVSPSYAALERTRATQVTARRATSAARTTSRQPTTSGQPTTSSARTSPRRRSLQRRGTATRRAPSRSTSVPYVAGGQRQPEPSTRQPLRLRPRPGCSASG